MGGVWMGGYHYRRLTRLAVVVERLGHAEDEEADSDAARKKHAKPGKVVEPARIGAV